MEIKTLIGRFFDAFGGGGGGFEENPRVFFAPGRVNLIGEHTDYNGGHVFPCGLHLGTYGAFRKRGDSVIKLVSGNMALAVETDADDLTYVRAHDWANYPKAVAWTLREAGYRTGGFEAYIFGDLPSGAGLSSSASVELLTAEALNALFELNIERVEMVKLCQRAENTFIGVNCGIMDQFASGAARKDSALLLNCATLEYSYVPLPLNEYRLIIAHTGVKRGLASSKYNERRAECELALGCLRRARPLDNLCEMEPETFERYKHYIKDPTARKRAEHVIYENARVLAAVGLLRAGDVKAFGRLMNESHISLRDLYEVTGPEPDALAEAAWAEEGVLGSRMTGGGFGGCTVSIVSGESVGRFIKRAGRTYAARTGLKAAFYAAETGGGAREIL